MRRILALLLSSTLLLAACGGDSDSGPDPEADPKAALTSALRNLATYEGLTAELDLRSTPDSLVALSEGELTPDLAQMILDSGVRLTVKEGDTPEDGQVELVVDIGGDAVELRVVDQVIYVRADVRSLVERFGGDTSELDGMTQGAPPGFEFINPALEGEWIAIEGAQQFVEQFGGAGAGGSEEDAELASAIANDLIEAVETNSTVTLVGSEDAGDHLEVKISVRGVFEAFKEIVSSVPGAGALPAESFPSESEIPEGDVTIDVWIDGDRVSQLELDFLKLAAAFSDEEIPGGVEEFAIRLALEEFTGDVEAPDAAERVNFQTLFQGIMGAGLGGMEAETEAPSDFAPDFSELCDQLAEAPPEVVEQFAEECPELQ